MWVSQITVFAISFQTASQHIPNPFSTQSQCEIEHLAAPRKLHMVAQFQMAPVQNTQVCAPLLHWAQRTPRPRMKLACSWDVCLQKEPRNSDVMLEILTNAESHWVMPNICRVKNNLQQYSGNGQFCFGQGAVSKTFVLSWRQKKCFMTAMQKQTQRVVCAQETIIYQPLALANLRWNHGNHVAGFTFVDRFMQSYVITVWLFSQDLSCSIDLSWQLQGAILQRYAFGHFAHHEVWMGMKMDMKMDMKMYEAIFSFPGNLWASLRKKRDLSPRHRPSMSQGSRRP